jgi:methylated-DNA-protein-cysteine methyltransferase-like protein
MVIINGKHYFDGTNLMQQLLENEGIKVVDQIIDFETILEPNKLSVDR